MLVLMIRPARLAVVAVLLGSALEGQLSIHGTSTPVGFLGTLDSSGQIPFAGNSQFKLSLHNHQNQNGGALGLALAPGNTFFGPATIYVSLVGLNLVQMPPGITELAIPIPDVPSIVGFSGAAQFGVNEPSMPGGIGLTNAIVLQVLPKRVPTRAYIPGQDFSSGSTAPGQMCVLDLSTQPPAFRATGTVGFSGSNGLNFPNKIAVAEGQQVAYALGNGTGNQFVRAFNIASDPVGVVVHTPIGDIPTADSVGTFAGARDMEVTADGHYLFTATGTGSTVTLEAFDTSTAPASLPSAAMQTIPFANAGAGAAGLELSPTDDRLVVLMSSDLVSTLVIYQINPGSAQVLTPLWFISLGAFPGNYNPADVHFSPDGRLLFVTGPNGVFNVIDSTTSPPAILIGLGWWPATPGTLWCHGSAVAVLNGAPVGVLATEGTAATYHLIDLNTTAPTFGGIIASFTTNPGGNGNVSNHRMHARQGMIVAVDETGSVADAQFVDVIDLDHLLAWRVKMPGFSSLFPPGSSCLPRDFDLY